MEPMSDTEDNVPDELEEQLDDLAEELRDPARAARTIEDQGEEGSIASENKPGDNAGQSDYHRPALVSPHIRAVDELTERLNAE